jgi:branched-chain amino acid transport system ATP-binding protein
VNLGLSQTFQIINLFKGLTVLENAVLAIQGFKRVKHTIHRRLSSYKSLVPQTEELMEQWGLWDRRDVRVSSLSYGEQRLLDIMLAMASTPRLLLLDEPTSGLSLAEISVVISKIKDLSREITVLLIEHNMEVALDLADRVTVLNVGQVVTEGTSAQIKGDPRVKKIYLRTEKE